MSVSNGWQCSASEASAGVQVLSMHRILCVRVARASLCTLHAHLCACAASGPLLFALLLHTPRIYHTTHVQATRLLTADIERRESVCDEAERSHSHPLSLYLLFAPPSFSPSAPQPLRYLSDTDATVHAVAARSPYRQERGRSLSISLPPTSSLDLLSLPPVPPCPARMARIREICP